MREETREDEARAAALYNHLRHQTRRLHQHEKSAFIIWLQSRVRIRPGVSPSLQECVIGPGPMSSLHFPRHWPTPDCKRIPGYKGCPVSVPWLIGPPPTQKVRSFWKTIYHIKMPILFLLSSQAVMKNKVCQFHDEEADSWGRRRLWKAGWPGCGWLVRLVTGTIWYSSNQKNLVGIVHVCSDPYANLVRGFGGQQLDAQ